MANVKFTEIHLLKTLYREFENMSNKQFNKINYSQLRHWNERKIIEEIVTPFIL